MDGCLVQVVVPDDSYCRSVKIFSDISFDNLSYSKSLFTASSFDLFAPNYSVSDNRINRSLFISSLYKLDKSSVKMGKIGITGLVWQTKVIEPTAVNQFGISLAEYQHL